MEYGGKEIKTSLISESSAGSSGDAAYALKKSNIYYVGKFIFVSILCFILYNTGSSWLGKLIEKHLTNKRAIGVLLVGRTTFPLFVWYLVHSLLGIGNKNLVDSWQFMIHSQLLWLHTLIYFALWIGCWFLPSSVIEFYINASKYISWFYLLLQIFFLIDMFYVLNEKWAREDNLKCIFALTIFLVVGSLTAFGLIYYFFGIGNCTGNIAIITVNLILCITIFVASIFLERGSIFTASLVCCYVAYLTAAGLMVSPDTQCSRVSSSASNTLYTVLASIFTLLWSAYSAFSATYQFNACNCKGICCESDDVQDDSPEFSISFFHFVFALASSYLTMIVTHWGYTGATSEGGQTYAWATDRGLISKWVNLTASWVTIALYALTLLAPIICPDRDFD